jgi:saccharopine dehydrogenase-like NADP-dependent oxidoreductase
MKIIVLGGGLVGGPMAADLAADSRFDVTVADIDEDVLRRLRSKYAVKTIHKDLSLPQDVKRLVWDYNFVLSAVPGFLGFQTLKAVIEAKKNVVDITFFAEDPFELDELASRSGVTALVDCGVAPGMSNILIGYVHGQLDETQTIMIYVGGLPEIRERPYEYKAVFSPPDVIEEYVRPARYIENGTLVVRPALSEPELLDFPGVGTLEAFNTDGLRTLAKTIPAPNMKERTLRYPGHIEKIALLRETGFFSREEIDIRGVRIRPLDVTAKLLFSKWKLHEKDRDITVLKIIVEGKKDGKRKRFTYDLLDRFDSSTGIHSMARTTGYTATVVLRMIARGMYAKKGISAPEFIGSRPECVRYILDGLRERGVIYRETIEDI